MASALESCPFKRVCGPQICVGSGSSKQQKVLFLQLLALELLFTRGGVAVLR